MQFSVAHTLVGMIAGLSFRVETLLLLVLATFGEALWWAWSNGLYAAFLWGLSAEIFLQIGYLAGICVRARFERIRFASASPSRSEA